MGPRRRSRLLVVVALTMILAAACGSSASSPSSPPATSTLETATLSPDRTGTASPGGAELPTSGRMELTDAGYAITLADNWFRIDLDEQGIQDLIEVGADQLPEGFADTVSAQVRQMVANGVSLLAYREADDDAPIGTNLNVISLSSFGMSLGTLESLNVAQIRQMLGADTEIDASRVELPSGEALLLRYEFPPEAGGDPIAIEQYFLLGEGTQLILTCTVPGDPEAIADECRAAAASVEFLP